ncbi:energy coupling factor transporter S component ThiW [Cytobacillus horneckiae]|uniref:Energy coupling factor transporter S component ThiW n=1 Tax=Cytobacillus horneckiae TaxID=549687 RepID=A0A2N0ZDY4_9BACI|nr:energy coupling factor transporter S component ThiW [Cytobacillus horneckiae]MEC1158020.1 energy coupling factor transporter S component ThiW [Cytobacillus horneckiae]MED2937055.1 energy coupling factor transporter S component ThiW [Cytobacillus horneckiae]PKG27716.1 energy coupling factor transporter S component ThiW [Cytobacillus horneckiae]
MNKTRKMTITAVIAAITTISSSMIFIPVGFAKIFPIQHLANVLSAVLLGPWYAVLQAFLSSTLRNMLGTGSVFAYPGSMIGAFLAAVLYQRTRKIGWAASGEVIGTGILGAIATYPIATLLLGQDATLFGFLPAFIISSFTGAALGYLFLKVLIKNHALGGYIHENSTNNSRL